MFKSLIKEPPTVGSIWVLRGEENNPFTNNYKVQVVEIKKGWVKYIWAWAIGSDRFYGDYLSIRRFRAIYREVE